MRRLVGFRGLYLKVFLLLIFISAFWVVGVGAEVVVVDWTEEDMYIGRMRWGSFLADYYREGTYLTTFSNLEDVNFHLEFDFDKEVVNGYFSASTEVTTSLVPYSHSAVGEISGVIRKVNWGGDLWYWEWEGTASVSLTFLMKQRYVLEGNEYWNTREETIQVNADFSGTGWSDYETTSAEINWQDHGGTDQALRSFTLSFSTDQGLEYVQLPKPIDLDVEIQAPSEVSTNDVNVVFNVVVSGEDVELVEQVLGRFCTGMGEKTGGLMNMFRKT